MRILGPVLLFVLHTDHDHVGKTFSENEFSPFYELPYLIKE